jgi:hypothetical protein
MTVNKRHAINTNYENLIPNDIISFEVIVKELKGQGRNISDRTIRYYITVKLLPKPMYIKKKAYFDRIFILNEINAIYTLQTLFGKGIAEIAGYAQKPFGTLNDIVGTLEIILQHKAFTALSKYKERPLGFRYVNSKLFQFVAQKYFEKINKGWWPEKMNNNEFIDAVLREYNEINGQ